VQIIAPTSVVARSGAAPSGSDPSGAFAGAPVPQPRLALKAKAFTKVTQGRIDMWTPDRTYAATFGGGHLQRGTYPLAASVPLERNTSKKIALDADQCLD